MTDETYFCEPIDGNRRAGEYEGTCPSTLPEIHTWENEGGRGVRVGGVVMRRPMSSLRVAVLALTALRLAVAAVVVSVALMAGHAASAAPAAPPCLCSVVGTSATCGAPYVVLGRTSGRTVTTGADPAQQRALMAGGCELWWRK